MQRTITIYIEPNESLINTIETYNRAVNDIMKVGFSIHTYNKLKLHHATYYDIRERYGLPASLVTCARDNASEMLKREKLKRLPTKRKHTAIRFNARTFSFNPKKAQASFSSIDGRVKFNIQIPEYFTKYTDWNITNARLSFNGVKLKLQMIAETNTPQLMEIDDVLGVDTGTYNHAVLSNNKFFNSKQIRAVKSRYQHLRGELQAKGTRSAKRKLKKVSGREKRFMADVNHRVANWIVNQPYNAIAIEKLGIKREKRLGHKFNQMLGNWSFGQLQSFIKYKAETLGKTVIVIDPRYTSQKCSRCGLIRKANRKRHNYTCKGCGLKLNADINASRNISNLGKSEIGRVFVDDPTVASSVMECSHSVSPQLQAPSS